MKLNHIILCTVFLLVAGIGYASGRSRGREAGKKSGSLLRSGYLLTKTEQ